MGCWVAELLPRSPYDARYTPQAAIIGFAFESQTGVHAFATDRRTGFRARPNGLAYVPQGCDVYSQSHDGGEYLKVVISPEHEEARFRDRRFSDVVDLPAIRAAQSLRTILLTGDPIDPVTFEYWLCTLIDRAAHVMGRDETKPRTGSWMTAHRLKRVDELIDDRLDDKLTVRELATAVGLSTGFFSRAFKASVGKAPHEYIIDRRISRARTLLQIDALELSRVALASGFTSHAHMTATFRRRLGVTPSHLRREFA
ncbi:MAG: helix-turn-helix domain-containing protein [Burkholderiales bacterium]